MTLPRDVTVVKLSHSGERVFSYAGEVVYADAKVVVARCPWPGDRTVDVGPVSFGPGDVFVEYYYLDEWFNILQVHDVRGVLKAWYANVTRPVEIADGEIRWRDLALDVLVLPDGHHTVLDRDEFEALALDGTVRDGAKVGLEVLLGWVRNERYPFRGI